MLSRPTLAAIACVLHACEAALVQSRFETSLHPASLPRRSSATFMSPKPPTAYLTREDGKNGKLQTLLSDRGVPTEELPCITFERLPGYDELRDAMVNGDHDWVVITSPEAAGVFIEAWRACKSPRPVKIASVGAGTAQVLADASLPSDFVPSKATGKTLAAELPVMDEDGPAGQVLYPASALAADVVESGLQSRGFGTRRIETYTTVPANWSEADMQRAREAEIVTFASPSAVRVWAERVGTGATAVCIGETSAKEARGLGFARVHCPEKPGVEAWADTVSRLGMWT